MEVKIDTHSAVERLAELMEVKLEVKMDEEERKDKGKEGKEKTGLQNEQKYGGWAKRADREHHRSP